MRVSWARLRHRCKSSSIACWAILAICAVSFVSPVFASEEGMDQQGSDEGVLVATVNIHDAALVSQEKNTFVLSFEIANREKIQPGIQYGVQLVQEDENGGQALVDEYIYPETLGLRENESVVKTVTYAAPEHLKGKHFLFLISKNTSNLPLAVMSVGEVELAGSGQYLEIPESQCIVRVVGDANAYGIFDNVDIAAQEELRVSCEVVNHMDREVSVQPVFTLSRQNALGQSLQYDQKIPAVITLDPQAKHTFDLAVPKISVPQAYTAKLVLEENGTALSNPIIVNYLVGGSMATIDNVTLDKASYKKGEIAQVSLFWSTPSDDFPYLRGKGESGLTGAMAKVSIADDQGKICSESLTAKLIGTIPESLAVPLVENCRASHIVLVLKDSQNNVLDEHSFVFIPQEKARETVLQKQSAVQKDFSSVWMWIVGALPLVFFFGYLIFRGGKKRFLSNFFVFLSFSIVLLGFGQGASADTFKGGCTNVTLVYNINKGAYLQGENMNATAFYSSAGTSSLAVEVRPMAPPYWDWNDDFVAGDDPAWKLVVSRYAKGGSTWKSVSGSTNVSVPNGAPGPKLAQFRLVAGIKGCNVVRVGPLNIGYTLASPAVNGVCGGAVNSCAAGSFQDRADSATQYLWSCVGHSGGATASCAINKPNNPPTTPTISGPVTGLAGTAYGFSAVATDPNGDALRYGFDWDNNGTVDQWVPAAGFVGSGVVRSASRLWTATGPTTFRVIAQDNRGLFSGWATHTINLNPPPPIITLTANPPSVNEGDTSVLSWSAAYAASCIASDGWSGSKPVSGSQAVTIDEDTLFTLQCVNSIGQSATRSVTVGCNVVTTYDDPLNELCSNKQTVRHRTCGFGNDMVSGLKNCNQGGNWQEVAP
jgi:hypothetical protein